MSHRAFFIAFVLMSVFCGHKTPRAIASVTGAAGKRIPVVFSPFDAKFSLFQTGNYFALKLSCVY